MIRYCVDSLRRLYLICGQNQILFKNLQRPFNNVIALAVVLAASQSDKNIQFLNENALPNLREFYLDDYDNKLQESKVMHFKNLEWFSYCNSLITQKYPFSFENLKHFIIHGSIELNDAFFNCIESIQQLQTLKINEFFWVPEHCTRESFRRLLALDNVSTTVEEIQIEYHKNMTTGLIHRFLTNSIKMKKFGFHISLPGPIKHFRRFAEIMTSYMDATWRCYIIEPYDSPYLYGRGMIDIKSFFIERIVF